MNQNSNIPTYNFYKTLDVNSNIVFSKLETSYNTYDSSLPHRHSYFEIIYFNESGGIHDIDFKTYDIKKNSIHFVSPKQVHLLRRNKNVTGYVISFSEDFFLLNNTNSKFLDSLPFLNNPYSIPIIELKSKDKQKIITNLISEIDNEIINHNSNNKIFIESFLTLLLLYSRRYYSDANSTDNQIFHKSETIMKFKKLIEEHFLTNKSVSFYSSELNITSGHLNELSKKELGKTASEIIYDRIIIESKRLLYHSEKSVKEISNYLNYEDPSYFVRFFKAHTDSTPEKFRKQICEKYH